MTIPLLVNGAIALFFLFSLILKSGYSYGAVLLLLTAFFTLPKWWAKRPHNADLRWLSITLILIGLIGIFDAWRSDLPPDAYDLPLRYLFAPLMLYFLATYPPKMRIIWLSAAAGAILAAISAHYYSHHMPQLLPNGRGSRYLHPIQFGNIAILLAVFSTCGLWQKKQGYLEKAFLSIGVLAGLYAAVLSETRGAFFALLWMLAILAALSLQRRHFTVRRVTTTVLIAITISSVFWIGNADIIDKRIDDIHNDIALYQAGNSNTSIGIRFELWHFAWQEGWRHPFIGAGTQQMMADKAAWVTAQNRPPFVAELTHLHNEFIDAFARHGIFGFLAVLAIFFFPLYFYYQCYRCNAKENSVLILAGSAHILLYSGFSLTQSALYSHNSGVLFFILPLCMIYGAARKTST